LPHKQLPWCIGSSPSVAFTYDTFLDIKRHFFDGLPGFVEFHMLRDSEKEGHVLNASHTIWRSREDFRFRLSRQMNH